MCGIGMGENYSKLRKGESDVKHCPQEKMEYIKNAFKRFGIINYSE